MSAEHVVVRLSNSQVALIRWVPGDDAGLARHIAESIHPRLVPVSPSVAPEEG